MKGTGEKRYCYICRSAKPVLHGMCVPCWAVYMETSDHSDTQWIKKLPLKERREREARIRALTEVIQTELQQPRERRHSSQTGKRKPKERPWWLPNSP